MNARRLLLAVVTSFCLFTAGALVTAPVAMAAGEEGCPNEAIRTSQDANALPECRAWEQVTPIEKDNVEPWPYHTEALESGEGPLASSSGEAMAWDAQTTLPESDQVTGAETVGLEYISRRGVDGWTSEDVIPRQSPEDGLLCSLVGVGMAGYTADLSKGVLADGWGQNYRSGGGVGEEDCGHNEPSLVPEEPEGFQNLFVRDNDALSYQLVNVTPGGVSPVDAQFEAGSADFSHVVFSESAPLTHGAPAGEDLYEWSGGTVRLVTYLPDGTPVQGTLPWGIPWEGVEGGGSDFFYDLETEMERSSASQFTHAISADGSRIFFQADGNLYVREDGTTTVQVDASQGPGPGGGGRFMAASADGSKVFFTDDASAGLTSSTVAGSGTNLYEYELPAQDGQPGTLTDLSAASDVGVLGLTGISEDGSYVYFVAEGDLAPGATVGRPNLYLIHSGVTTFIATLQAAPTTRIPGTIQGAKWPEVGDSCDWFAQCLTASVSPNGRYLAFTSVESLTGYANEPVEPKACALESGYNAQPEACREVFFYEAGSNKLACASCNPTGERPTAYTVIRTPGVLTHSKFLKVGYPPRYVTDSGLLFFDTTEALVPHDNNGTRDVYEYKEGHPYLISSGSAAGEAYFVGASEDGSNVFFETGQQLARRDTDESYDIYDARVDGGFPEPSPQPQCADEGCRGLASNPPVLSLPDSASLISSGNVTSIPVVTSKAKPKSKSGKCKKGYVKKKGKCVRKRKAKAKKSAKGRK